MDISDRKVERNTVEMTGGDEGWEDKPSWGAYTVYAILVTPSQRYVHHATTSPALALRRRSFTFIVVPSNTTCTTSTNTP